MEMDDIVQEEISHEFEILLPTYRKFSLERLGNEFVKLLQGFLDMDEENRRDVRIQTYSCYLACREVLREKSFDERCAFVQYIADKTGYDLYDLCEKIFILEKNRFKN